MIPDYHLKTFHPLCYSCDSESCLVGLTLCDPLYYKVHGNLQTRILEWVAFPFYRGSSQPRDWLQISRIVDRFFIPAEPQGKPKNTGVGRLSLLQWIFPSQESIRGLLHSLPTELSGKPFLFLELSEGKRHVKMLQTDVTVLCRQRRAWGFFVIQYPCFEREGLNNQTQSLLTLWLKLYVLLF